MKTQEMRHKARAIHTAHLYAQIIHLREFLEQAKLPQFAGLQSTDQQIVFCVRAIAVYRAERLARLEQSRLAFRKHLRKSLN